VKHVTAYHLASGWITILSCLTHPKEKKNQNTKIRGTLIQLQQLPKTCINYTDSGDYAFY